MPINEIYFITIFLKILFFIKAKSRKYQGGIRGEKSSKYMASSMNLVSTIGAQARINFILRNDEFEIYCQ